MKHHKYSSSVPKIEKKESRINQIIVKCEETKQQIDENVSEINKQSDFQRTEWKSVQRILKTDSLSHNTNLSVSQEIHKKIRKIYESQINEKSRRLLKFMNYAKNQTISESDLCKQETFKFLSVNKREFGSPLKNISYFPKKNPKKAEKFGANLDPEETVLMDIHAIRMKQSISNGKNLRKRVMLKEKDEGEISLKGLSYKNKIVYGELKKIYPVLNCSFGVKDKNFRSRFGK